MSVIYKINLGASDETPGLVWRNRPRLINGALAAGPHKHPLGLWGRTGSGFPVEMEHPEFVLSAAAGRLPLQDIEGLGLNVWLVSETAKRVFEGVDASAFVFSPADVRANASAQSSEPHWICDVVRFVDAVDDERSGIKPFFVDGSKYTIFRGGEDAYFRRPAVGKHHIFRAMYAPSEVLWDESMLSAVQAAGLQGCDFSRQGVIDAA